MDILFLDPPVLIGKKIPERVFGCTYGLYPMPNIFILQVAAVLKQDGHTVSYKNFALEKASVQQFSDFLKKQIQKYFASIVLIYPKK